MYVRDNVDVFEEAIVCLKNYKHQLEKDVSTLIHAPKSALEEEKLADQYHSDSPASKRKRADEYALAIQLYEKEHNHFLSILNTLRTQQMKEIEISDELLKKARKENQQLNHFLDHSQNQPNKESEKNAEILKQIIHDITQQLDEIKKSITQLQQFIHDLNHDIAIQRDNFIQQFQEEMRNYLLGKNPGQGNDVEIDTGNGKIYLNVVVAEMLLAKIVRQEFANNDVYDHDRFKQDVKNAFADLIIKQHTSTSENKEAHQQSHHAASAIASAVLDRHAKACSNAFNADKAQTRELQWAQDCLKMALSKEAQLQQALKAYKEAKPADLSTQDIQKQVNFVEKSKGEIATIKHDVNISQEKRTSTALAALRDPKLMQSLLKKAKQTISQATNNQLKPK